MDLNGYKVVMDSSKVQCLNKCRILLEIKDVC